MTEISAETQGGIVQSQNTGDVYGPVSRECNWPKVGLFAGAMAGSIALSGTYEGGPLEWLIDSTAIEPVIQDFVKHPAPILAITGATSELVSRVSQRERIAQTVGLVAGASAGVACEYVGSAVKNTSIKLTPFFDFFVSHDFQYSDMKVGLGAAVVGALLSPLTRRVRPKEFANQ